MTALSTVDTSQLNGVKSHLVTCTSLYSVGTKHRLRNKNTQTSRLPPKTPLLTEITSLIENYVEQEAILLAGRIAAYKRDDIKLLYHVAQVK